MSPYFSCGSGNKITILQHRTLLREISEKSSETKRKNIWGSESLGIENNGRQQAGSSTDEVSAILTVYYKTLSATKYISKNKMFQILSVIIQINGCNAYHEWRQNTRRSRRWSTNCWDEGSFVAEWLSLREVGVSNLGSENSLTVIFRGFTQIPFRQMLEYLYRKQGHMFLLDYSLIFLPFNTTFNVL
jgi:hypothetical protein